MISIIGIPTDTHSSYQKGAAESPNCIMNSFESNATNKFSESGIDLGKKNIFEYKGCISLNNQEDEFRIIKQTIINELSQDRVCISLGGDHSITYPIIDAYHKRHPKIDLLHFDAHPDLYDNFNNDPLSHASPFARIMENNLINNLTQLGIRTLNDHQKKQAKKFNVKMISMSDFNSDLIFSFKNPVYISVDLDVLDPAFAPGVSHPEPGGLTTRDLLNMLSKINQKIIGADIVELNPENDINNITSITAAKILKEIMGVIVENYK